MQLYIPSKKERLKNAFVRAILLKKEKEKSVGIGMENELACWGPCSDVWRRYSCMIQSVFLPFGARPL
jgi:hypothetical protein